MVKKKWLKDFLSDKYVKDANREGFRSRAAFKLLEIDEEFDKSKLKWNGESMMYGEDWVGDTSGTKPNSDIDITCQYDSEKDGVSTYFSHTWY